MKLLPVLLLAWIALSQAGLASAALINVAPSGTATASNTWLTNTADWSAKNAIDGDTSTIWNAGSFSPEWIEIDLGRSVLIESIAGLTEQFPQGFTRHNVFLDGVFHFDWSESTTSSQWLTHDFVTPILAQTIRIDTLRSPSWVAWREIQVFTSAVPVTSTIWLLAIGIPAVMFTRRMKGRHR